MTWIIVLIIIAIVVGIIVLSTKGSHKPKTREESLQAMTDFVEGTLGTLEGYPNSYKVTFVYKGEEFEFNDIENHGLGEVSYRGYLKIKSKSQLTVNFTERPRGRVTVDMVKASEITNQKIEDLRIPKVLKQFKIFTNSIWMTNAFLADDQVLSILTKLKFMGDRGHPVMPIRIQNGELALDFYEDVTLKPNLYDLRQNVTAIDSYANQMIVIVKTLNKLEERRKQKE